MLMMQDWKRLLANNFRLFCQRNIRNSKIYIAVYKGLWHYFSFSYLFEELENHKEELSIKSFGLSFNTLEQVFLRVGEIADPEDDQVDSSITLQNATALYGNITSWSFVLDVEKLLVDKKGYD